jgi:hypothetical protein
MFRRYSRYGRGGYGGYGRRNRSRVRKFKPSLARGLVRGRRARGYLKGKRAAKRALTVTFYGIVQNPKNIPAGVVPQWAPNGMNAAIPANGASWSAWFGPAYAAGGALIAQVDGNGNPTQVGNGMLQQINRRCPDIGFNSYEYGAFFIDRAQLMQIWAQVMPNVPIGEIFLKGYKVSVLTGNTNINSPFFLFYMKDAAAAGKYRQNIGKTKAYFKARKDLAVGAPVKWNVPNVWIGGLCTSNISIKLYYKEKRRV